MSIKKYFKLTIHYCFVILISLFIVDCKSVDVSVMGYYNKNISKKVNSEKIQDMQIEPDNTMTLLSGFVSDKLKHPIVGALIFLQKDSQIVSVAVSDKNGRYVLPDLTDEPVNEMLNQNETTDAISSNKDFPEKYLLSVSATGFKSMLEYVELQNEISQQDYCLEKLNVISGIVTKCDSSCISGALIQLQKDDEIISVDKSDSSGIFKFEEVESGIYSISVSHANYTFPKKTIEVKTEILNKEITISSGKGVIRGSLITVDSTIKLAKAIITLQRTDIDGFNSYQPFHIIDTIENRLTYMLEGLIPGNYKLKVNAAGYGGVSAEVVLNNTQMQYVQDFTLYEEGIISGRLVDYVAGEDVSVIIINTSNTYETNNIEIEKNGNYSIKGLAPGLYTCGVKWCGALIFKDSVSVATGKETSNIDFLVNKTSGTISGRVVSISNNEPIENAIIIASSKESGNYAISDNYGCYKIEGLSPGSYDVMVTSQKYEPSGKNNLLLENEEILKNIDFNLINQAK